MKFIARWLIVLSGVALMSAQTAWTAPAGPEQSKPERKVVASIRLSRSPESVGLPALAKIPFDQAFRAALNAVPGSIIKAELEVEDGNLMYSFEIVTRQKTLVEVEVDAGDGKVLDIDHD